MILVDAECSHDGSFKHLIKYIENNNPQSNWYFDNFNKKVLSTHDIKEITNLQFNLLKNAIDLVENNGYIYYSTCSISYSQNEEIINKILS